MNSADVEREITRRVTVKLIVAVQESIMEQNQIINKEVEERDRLYATLDGLRRTLKEAGG